MFVRGIASACVKNGRIHRIGLASGFRLLARQTWCQPCQKLIDALERRDADIQEVSANSHAEFSVERFETVARTAKNLLHEVLLAIA